MIMNKHLSTCPLYSPPALSFRFLSLFFSLSLPVCCQAADLTIERNPVLKPRPDPSTLVFGKQFSDHMLTVCWSEAGGWEAPQIKPFQNLSLHPASSALHYSIEVRECVSRMAHGIFFSFIQNTIDFISPSLVFSPEFYPMLCHIKLWKQKWNVCSFFLDIAIIILKILPLIVIIYNSKSYSSYKIS